MSIVIDSFKEISKIPRCSKNVKGIINFIKERSKKFGYSFKEDSVGNLVVQIKSNSNINMHPIILQSHVDMVCEKMNLVCIILKQIQLKLLKRMDI